MQMLTWLVDNAILLTSIVATITIIATPWGVYKFFKSSPPPLSAEDIAQKVAEKQKDEKAEAMAEQVEQLTLAVKDLQNKQAEPDAPAGIDSALKELAQGNTIKAENIFRQILQDKIKEGKQANREAGKAARHLGALAFFHDTGSSLTAYQQAVQLDPENPDGWNQLGHLQRRTGDMDGALKSYNKVLSIGKAAGQKGLLAIAYTNLGIIYMIRGDLDKAEEYYKKALAITEKLGIKEVSANQYTNLGIIYKTRGDLDQAREVWGKAKKLYLAIGTEPGVKKVQGWIDGL